MVTNPLDGFVYYVNIYNGTLFRITFEGPTWVNEPQDLVLECGTITDVNAEFNNWLNSFGGTVTCGNPSGTHNSTGLLSTCGSAVEEEVMFNLEDECGNRITKVATFSTTDTTAPNWDSVGNTLITDCAPDIQQTYESWLNSFTGSDACGTATVTHDGPVTISCPISIMVNFTLTDECGNQSFESELFKVENTLSIESPEDFYQLDVFPNPAKDYLRITGLNGVSYLEIYSVRGQKFKSEIIQNNQKVPLNLPSGFYILKITDGNFQSLKKLIIK